MASIQPMCAGGDTTSLSLALNKNTKITSKELTKTPSKHCMLNGGLYSVHVNGHLLMHRRQNTGYICFVQVIS